MARRLVVLVALCTVAALGAVPRAADAAAEPIWDIVSNASSGTIGSLASKTFAVGCPAGEYTPISGGYSGQNDLRRASERLVFGKGGFYEVRLDNNTAAADTVTLTIQCVPTSYFSTSKTVSSDSFTQDDQRNHNSLTCGGDQWFALLPSVAFATAGGNVLTTGRANAWSGWWVEGWHGTDGAKMTTTLTCVPKADVPGFYGKTQSFAMSQWATPTSVTCPSGMVAIGGGTLQSGVSTLNGPWGAISILGHLSGNTYSSVAETLDGGTMNTSVDCLPAQNPSVSVTGAPSPAAGSDGAAWTIGVTDPASAGNYTITLTCTLRHLTAGTSEAPATCSKNFPFEAAGLADGDHRLDVRATTSDGRQATGSAEVTIDSTAPTVSLTRPTARFTLGTATTVAWLGSDATTSVASYATRVRTATHQAGFGEWGTPVVNGGTATRRAFTGLARGRTYCFSTQAVDERGNTSPWTSSRCTAVPLDDRDLTRTSGWNTSPVAGWFRGTASSTTRSGQALSVGATTRRIALVAQRCPSCGKVAVLVGSTRIGTIDLKGARARRTYAVPAFATRTATVTVKVLSSGKPVKIDALGLSAR